MFAIVEIAGKQYKVQKDDQLFVQHLDAEIGASVDAKILMSSDGSTATFTEGNAKAEVLEQLKGDKVITFHKKRRKGYEKKIGHRDHLTKIKITSL
jgi:large subunit ribosomal protein L21